MAALVVVLSALAALVLSDGTHLAQAHGSASHHHPLPLSAKTYICTDMRKLWEDHVTWTRLAIISLETGTPDAEATVTRLLRNQTDIGNAIKPYYGDAAGNQLTRQLRDPHLDRSGRHRRGEGGQSGEARRGAVALVKNADQIAATLDGVNPRYWKLRSDEGRDAHAPQARRPTKQSRGPRANGTPTSPSTTRSSSHILHMSDMLSGGILAQFPGRFR